MQLNILGDERSPNGRGVFIQRNGTMEWNGGMERWNGMEWNSGMTTPTECVCDDLYLLYSVPKILRSSLLYRI